MQRLSAGNLDRWVTLLRRLPSRDDGRRTVPGAWEKLVDRKASVKPKMGGEAFEAEGLAGRRVLSVWLRYDEVTAELTEQDALSIDGVHHDLVAPPIEIGHRLGIELLAATPGVRGAA